ncbi:unnamed protein product, partial [Nesidiocoris tenuis]
MVLVRRWQFPLFTSNFRQRNLVVSQMQSCPSRNPLKTYQPFGTILPKHGQDST